MITIRRFIDRILYHTGPKLKTFMKIFVDLFVITIAYVFSFTVRFEWIIPYQYLNDMIFSGIFLLIVSFFVYYFVGAYSSIWFYWSLRDFKRLAWSHALAVLILFVAARIFDLFLVPLSIIFIYLIFGIGALGTIRFLVRYMRETQIGKVLINKRLLIIGAGSAGEMLARQIHSSPGLSYHIIGFIDDDPRKRKTLIHGIRVLGTCDDLQYITIQKEIDEIIIAIPSASAIKMRHLVSVCEKTKLTFRTVPGYREIIRGDVALTNIRKVQIEDLLDREQSEMDINRIKKLVENKIVCVTGAAGSIGSELCRLIMQFHPKKLIAIDKDENKLFYLGLEFRNAVNYEPCVMHVGNEIKLKAIFSIDKPQIIFHAAAYKHVPMMERNPEEAILNNLESTKVITKIAIELKIPKFIFISTDKAVYPTTVMGASKRLCERYLHYLNSQGHEGFITVRFGNVLGSQGSVGTIFSEQIKRGQPLTITHPQMRRFFMSIQEACRLVLESAALSNGRGTFVLDMGDPIPIVEFAEHMIRLAGLEPYHDIPITFSGIRPGEKLDEQLWYQHERPNTTANSKIFVTELLTQVEENFSQNVNRIIQLAKENNVKDMIEQLKKTLLEFSPKENQTELPLDVVG